MTLSWSAATDEITLADKLVYRVVSSTDGNDLNAISDFASASEVSPYNVRKDSVQIKGLFREYKNVGRFFAEWAKDSKLSFAISTKEKNSCTTCHRIGSQNTCDNFAAQSIGQETTRDLSDYGSKTFKLSHWMPPSGHGVETIQDWQNDEAGMRSDADKLLACCYNPDAIECVKKPINSLPAPYTLRD